MEIKSHLATKTIKKTNILDHVTLTIKKGSIYGLIGPNGAGKTTFIRSMLQIYSLTSGNITIDGVSVNDKQFYKVKQNIGCVLDFLGLYKDLSAWENVEFFHRLFFPKATAIDRRQDIEKALKQVNLIDKKDSRIIFFSKGQKQRLAIARAIINRPKLLILDEPTNGLDVENIISLREYLLEINKKGVTIFISSHNLSELEKISTNIGFLGNGKILKEIDSKELNINKNIHTERSILESEYKKVFGIS